MIATRKQRLAVLLLQPRSLTPPNATMTVVSNGQLHRLHTTLHITLYINERRHNDVPILCIEVVSGEE